MKIFFKVMALVVFALVNAEVAPWGEGIQKSFGKVGNEIRNAGEAVRDQFNGKAKARAAAQQKVNEAASVLKQKEVDFAAAQEKLAVAQAERARAQMELNVAQDEFKKLS